LNSIVIIWGDSLRAYGLGAMLAASVTLVMWWFLEKPTWKRAGVLVVPAVLGVQTLYQDAVLFAAVCAGGWMVCWRQKNSRAALMILAVAIMAALSLLPYHGAIQSLAHDTAARRAGFMPKMAWNDWQTLAGFPLPAYAVVWILVAIAVVALTVRRHPDERSWFAATVLAATAAGFVFFLWVVRIETQAWYFLPPAAVLATCFELCPLPLARSRTVHLITHALVIGTVLIAVPMATLPHRDLNYRFTNIDVVAGQLARDAAPDDFIVVTPWYLGISFDHYFKGRTPWETAPPVADHSIHRYDLADRTMNDPAALQPVLDRIAATLAGGHRVWVVGWMYVPAKGKPSNVVGRHLVDHSVDFRPVSIPTNAPVYDYEEVQLRVAAGWRTNAP